MPADITGTDIIEDDEATGRRRWTFSPGPLFGNVVLADEINRTPPKTQSALLEAMQEHSCTVRGTIHRLPAPFFVLATQNPMNWKALIRCLRHSWTGFCSTRCSTTWIWNTRCRSLRERRPRIPPRRR